MDRIEFNGPGQTIAAQFFSLQGFKDNNKKKIKEIPLSFPPPLRKIKSRFLETNTLNFSPERKTCFLRGQERQDSTRTAACNSEHTVDKVVFLCCPREHPWLVHACSAPSDVICAIIHSLSGRAASYLCVTPAPHAPKVAGPSQASENEPHKTGINSLFAALSQTRQTAGAFTFQSRDLL